MNPQHAGFTSQSSLEVQQLNWDVSLYCIQMWVNLALAVFVSCCPFKHKKGTKLFTDNLTTNYLFVFLLKTWHIFPWCAACPFCGNWRINEEVTGLKKYPQQFVDVVSFRNGEKKQRPDTVSHGLMVSVDSGCQEAILKIGKQAEKAEVCQITPELEWKWVEISLMEWWNQIWDTEEVRRDAHICKTFQ